MKVEQLKEDVIRAEGYAEGFKAGYISCAQKIVNDMAKEEKAKNEGTEPPKE